jgi:hypothetical protein
LKDDAGKTRPEVVITAFVGNSIFDYFVSFTFLLGDLCLKRNYKAIECLQKLIPYEICYSIITKENYSISIKEAFTYLITTLWVDVAPFQKVLIPNHIKFWDTSKKLGLEDGNIIDKRDECLGLKKEALRYLSSIQEFMFYEEDHLKLLIMMLKLLKYIFVNKFP